MTPSTSSQRGMGLHPHRHRGERTVGVTSPPPWCCWRASARPSQRRHHGDASARPSKTDVSTRHHSAADAPQRRLTRHSHQAARPPNAVVHAPATSREQPPPLPATPPKRKAPPWPAPRCTRQAASAAAIAPCCVRARPAAPCRPRRHRCATAGPARPRAQLPLPAMPSTRGQIRRPGAQIRPHRGGPAASS